ncbi:MAG: hypothetical protein JOZ87_35685 [Chloroflexi bacterium]|nr:hypothetical protein [Chloroflexota bacterium]
MRLARLVELAKIGAILTGSGSEILPVCATLADFKTGEAFVNVRPPGSIIDRCAHGLAIFTVVDDVDTRVNLLFYNLADG